MDMDAELEVHRGLRESQNRYTYFLLGVACAAIALAVTQTQGTSLSWFQLPLAAAVLCWGLSFYFGCLNRAYNNAGLLTNVALCNVRAGRHSDIGTHPQAIEEGSKILKEIFENQSSKANLYANLQFRFLIAGAVLYVAWHVLEMYLRTL